MIDHADIEGAARELVERHGKEALAHARERVEEAKKAGDQPAMDLALRVLTACERLVEANATPSHGGRDR